MFLLHSQMIPISVSNRESITGGNVEDNCSSFSNFFFPVWS